MTRSNLHVLTCHNGSSWMDDIVVEGEFGGKVREILGGDPDRHRELIPGVSQAFYRGSTTVLVLTFPPDVSRRQAETMVHSFHENRDDLN